MGKNRVKATRIGAGWDISIVEHTDGGYGWEVKMFGKVRASGAESEKDEAEKVAWSKLRELTEGYQTKSVDKAPSRLKLRELLHKRTHLVAGACEEVMSGTASKADLVSRARDIELNHHNRTAEYVRHPLPTHGLAKTPEVAMAQLVDAWLVLGMVEAQGNVLVPKRLGSWADKVLGMDIVVEG